MNHRRFAICTVRLSIYIWRVSFPEANLSISFCTVWTLLIMAGIASGHFR